MCSFGIDNASYHDDKIDETTTELRKPEIITFYNTTKGGVDTADQMCGEYNVARNTKRWTMVVFYGILNIAGLNAAIVYFAKRSNRRSFLKQLGMELLKDHLKDRAKNDRVPAKTRANNARKFVGLPDEQVSLIEKGVTRRDCNFCTNRRKSRYFCEKCSKCICLQHAHTFCLVCASNIVEERMSE